MSTDDIESSRRVFRAFSAISDELHSLNNDERRRLVEALVIVATAAAAGDGSTDALAVSAAANVIMGKAVE